MCTFLFPSSAIQRPGYCCFYTTSLIQMTKSFSYFLSLNQQQQQVGPVQAGLEKSLCENLHSSVRHRTKSIYFIFLSVHLFRRSNFTFSFIFPFLACAFGTLISALGLSVASCMSMTPNNGSGALSASSRSVRASGRSRAGLKGEADVILCFYVRWMKCCVAVLTCFARPYRSPATSSVSPAAPRRTEAPLENHAGRGKEAAYTAAFPSLRSANSILPRRMAHCRWKTTTTPYWS